MVPNTETFEHGTLPEAASTKDACQGVHNAQYEDALDWPRDNAQSQGMRVVLIPSLDIECHGC